MPANVYQPNGLVHAPVLYPWQDYGFEYRQDTISGWNKANFMPDKPWNFGKRRRKGAWINPAPGGSYHEYADRENASTFRIIDLARHHSGAGGRYTDDPDWLLHESESFQDKGITPYYVFSDEWHSYQQQYSNYLTVQMSRYNEVIIGTDGAWLYSLVNSLHTDRPAVMDFMARNSYTGTLLSRMCSEYVYLKKDGEIVMVVTAYVGYPIPTENFELLIKQVVCKRGALVIDGFHTALAELAIQYLGTPRKVAFLIDLDLRRNPNAERTLLHNDARWTPYESIAPRTYYIPKATLDRRYFASPPKSWDRNNLLPLPTGADLNDYWTIRDCGAVRYRYVY